MLGFNDMSALVGHFMSSPREREKRDRRDLIVEEMKEMDRKERGAGMKVKRRNKNIFPLPLSATRIAGLAQL